MVGASGNQEESWTGGGKMAGAWRPLACSKSSPMHSPVCSTCWRSAACTPHHLEFKDTLHANYTAEPDEHAPRRTFSLPSLPVAVSWASSSFLT